MNRLQDGIRILQCLLILGGMMIVGLFIASSVITLLSGGGLNRSAVLWGSVAQNIFAFIVPAILLPYFIGRKAGGWIETVKFGRGAVYLWIIVMAIVSLPAMNMLVSFNEGIHLPAGMKNLEDALRRLEEHGSASAALLLDNATFGQMIVSVLAVGILTGIGEEFFFRGGLQNILTKFGCGHFWAILISAIIFSAAHFQFFGFIPRMILGVWFGWLYCKTGSIWPAAAAHALNNSLVVVSSWMISRGWLAENFEMFGTSGWLGTIVILLSFCLICLIIYRIEKETPSTGKASETIEIDNRTPKSPKQ